ncbi:hypothetical protein ACJX0J_017539, partial [Zea mays]
MNIAMQYDCINYFLSLAVLFISQSLHMYAENWGYLEVHLRKCQIQGDATCPKSLTSWLASLVMSSWSLVLISMAPHFFLCQEYRYIIFQEPSGKKELFFFFTDSKQLPLRYFIVIYASKGSSELA